MKNWGKFLAFLSLPAIALIGCANTSNHDPEDHYWQDVDAVDYDDERATRMEREIYRDK